MAALTDYAENALLNHLLKTAAFTMPAGCFLALFTAAPSDAGGGTEVTGGSYARQSLTFGAAVNGSASNTNAVSFPSMPAVTVTHGAIMDTLTAGNMLLHGAFGTAQTVAAGVALPFAIGDIVAVLQ